MKQWLLPAIVLLAVGLAGIGVGWSVNEWWRNDESPDGRSKGELPVQQRRLTGSEAGGLARGHLVAEEGGAGIDIGEVYRIVCEAKDFNEADDAWIVLCRHPDGANMTYRVFDDTGRVEALP